jgi:F-type H+-transporting ATPase subunit alpha
LKQAQYQPMSIWEQVASLFAVNEGTFDVVPVAKIKEAQGALLTKLWTEHKEEMRTLNKGDKPDEKLLAAIKKTAQAVAKGFGA